MFYLSFRGYYRCKNERVSCKTNIDFLLNKQLQWGKKEALWNKTSKSFWRHWWWSVNMFHISTTPPAYTRSRARSKKPPLACDGKQPDFQWRINGKHTGWNGPVLLSALHDLIFAEIMARIRMCFEETHSGKLHVSSATCALACIIAAVFSPRFHSATYVTCLLTAEGSVQFHAAFLSGTTFARFFLGFSWVFASSLQSADGSPAWCSPPGKSFPPFSEQKSAPKDGNVEHCRSL